MFRRRGSRRGALEQNLLGAGYIVGAQFLHRQGHCRVEMLRNSVERLLKVRNGLRWILSQIQFGGGEGLERIGISRLNGQNLLSPSLAFLNDIGIPACAHHLSQLQLRP